LQNLFSALSGSQCFSGFFVPKYHYVRQSSKPRDVEEFQPNAFQKYV